MQLCHAMQVQPACAYLSALTRKYPSGVLWTVLLNGAPPLSQPNTALNAATPAAGDAPPLSQPNTALNPATPAAAEPSIVSQVLKSTLV